MTVHMVMPRLPEVLGATAASFPDGYRLPPIVLVRHAARENGRQAGTVEIADYGRVEFTVTPKGYDRENWLDWVYTAKDGTVTSSRWQQ